MAMADSNTMEEQGGSDFVGELLSHWIGLMHKLPMGLFRNDIVPKWINSS